MTHDIVTFADAETYLSRRGTSVSSFDQNGDHLSVSGYVGGVDRFELSYDDRAGIVSFTLGTRPVVEEARRVDLNNPGECVDTLLYLIDKAQGRPTTAPTSTPDAAPASEPSTDFPSVQKLPGGFVAVFALGDLNDADLFANLTALITRLKGN